MASDTAVRDERLHRFARHPVALWISFLVVHIAIGYLCLHADGMPLGDVTLVYEPWAQQASTGLSIVGLDAPWVYPPLALIPILLPILAGHGNYVGGWLTVVTLFDAVAFAVLTVRARDARRIAAAWWWLGFLLVLGPIAMGRLDAISVAIAIVGLLWLRTRPRVAGALLAVATWIKVWPAALIAGVLVASRRRMQVLAAVVGTSLIVIILGVTFGSPANLFSFITEQTARGLQIEAPISAPWMWQAALHVGGGFIYYDHDLLTFQVAGPGVAVTAALMTPLLAAVAIAVLLLGIRAAYSGAGVLRVLPSLSLALVTTMIAFNKVGSPQYIAWLAAPAILGIVALGRRFATPAILVGITGALTQLVYPYLYDGVLSADIVMVAVLTIRNVMLFVVLGWAVYALWRSAETGRDGRSRMSTADGHIDQTDVDGTSGVQRTLDSRTLNTGWPFAAPADRKD